MQTVASKIASICFGSLAVLPLNLVDAQESASVTDFSKIHERVRAVIDSVSPAIVRFAYGKEPKLQFGCGVIVSASGDVVVSGPVQAVIDDALLDLHLVDGRSVSGKAVGWSHEFGFGMLKITDSGKWPHVKLSKWVEAGEVCLALGYPSDSIGKETSPGIRLGIVMKIANGQWLTTSYRSTFGMHPVFNLDGELLGLNCKTPVGGDAVHAATGVIEAHWAELAAARNLDRARLYTQQPGSTKSRPLPGKVGSTVIAKAKTASVRISEIGVEENRVSGVIVTRDGYVITCGHHGRVPGTKMTVSLQDGRSANAIVRGTNLVSDVGVLKITDEGTWPYAEMGCSAEMDEGEHCIVIGYPRSKPGREPWVLPTTMAKPHWQLPKRDEWDCAFWTKGSPINTGGASGGGVFDAQGRVVGVLLGGVSGRSANGADLSQLQHSRVELFRKNWEALTSSMPVQVAVPKRLADVTASLNRIADELSAEEHR
jgi:S1-C subfamily serine protease